MDPNSTDGGRLGCSSIAVVADTPSIPPVMISIWARVASSWEILVPTLSINLASFVPELLSLQVLPAATLGHMRAVRKYLCIWGHAYIYAYMCVSIYVYMINNNAHTYMYAHMYTYMYIRIDVYTHTSVYVYVHTHTYVYIYIYIYICMHATKPT